MSADQKPYDLERAQAKLAFGESASEAVIVDATINRRTRTSQAVANSRTAVLQARPDASKLQKLKGAKINIVPAASKKADANPGLSKPNNAA